MSRRIQPDGRRLWSHIREVSKTYPNGVQFGAYPYSHITLVERAGYTR